MDQISEFLQLSIWSFLGVSQRGRWK